MSKTSFKPSTMLNPVPVVMVSCGEKNQYNIITIAWCGIINSEPPMTYISVRKSRFSHDILAKNKEFVINLVNEELVQATDYCGVKSGRDIDKFKQTGLTPISADLLKCPMIKESPINIECKVMDIVEYPSHDMFIAEIKKVHVDDELINNSGKILFEKAKLVCYNHGAYFALKALPIGGFGYSVMKPKTKKKKNGIKRANQREKG